MVGGKSKPQPFLGRPLPGHGGSRLYTMQELGRGVLPLIFHPREGGLGPVHLSCSLHELRSLGSTHYLHSSGTELGKNEVKRVGRSRACGELERDTISRSMNLENLTPREPRKTHQSGPTGQWPVHGSHRRASAGHAHFRDPVAHILWLLWTWSSKVLLCPSNALHPLPV